MAADWHLGRWRRLVNERQNVAGNLAAHRRQGLPGLPQTPLLATAIAGEVARLRQIDEELEAMGVPAVDQVVERVSTPHCLLDGAKARRELERRMVPG
jgi:hypothetical protein